MRSFLLLVGLLTILLLAALAAFIRFTYGHSSRALAAYSGRSIVVEPELIDLGDVPAGEIRSFKVTLHNATGSPARIHGIDSGCACTYLGDELPFTVPARGDRELSFNMGAPATSERVQFSIAMYVESDARPTMLQVRARIVESEKAGAGPASGE